MVTISDFYSTHDALRMQFNELICSGRLGIPWEDALSSSPQDGQMVLGIQKNGRWRKVKFFVLEDKPSGYFSKNGKRRDIVAWFIVKPPV